MMVPYACDCVWLCVNFGDEILLSEEECKTREKNAIFLKNCKMVISIETRKFSRSRMTKRIVPLNSSCEI